MGSKGSQVQTSQSQSYQPNPQAVGDINYAMQQGQNAAGAPFQQPVAPVAGFSPDQYSAFQGVRNAQGTAQPYINAGANLFARSAMGPDISQFFNPFAGAVGANLKDVFGQQMSQATGQLTQAAGGVGADRIAVGQSELAKQQGLAAGQTFAGLYQPSLGAAEQEQNIQQGAGYGMGVLGPAAQNSAFQGYQQLLGTGGLQQQLSQAQMNAPYQNELARLAYPFQTAQFLGGLTGSLAPGLGGTTTGNGATTYPGPSPFSQILGAGTAAAGLYGGMGGFGPGSNYQAMNTGNTSINNPGPGVFNGSFGWARGGAINPYAFDEGGVVPLPNPPVTWDHFMDVNKKGQTREALTRALGMPDNVIKFPQKDDGGGVSGNPYLQMMEMQQLRGDAGGGDPMGGSLPSGMNGKPINAAPQSVVPATPWSPIQPHIPQLPAPPQQQSGSGSGGPSAGEIIGDGLKLAAMFAQRGGRANGFLAGGAADAGGPIEGAPLQLPWDRDVELNLKTWGLQNSQDARSQAYKRHTPKNFADGGAPVDASDITLEAGPGGYGRHQPWAPTNPALLADSGLNPNADRAPRDAAGVDNPDSAYNRSLVARPSPGRSMAALPFAAEGGGDDDSPWSAVHDDRAAAPASPRAPTRDHGFVDSPWAALTAAGLGMMAGTSPYAGVNIGQGGLQGMKMLGEQRGAAQKQETIEQAAARLDQRARFHEDQFNRVPLAEKQKQKEVERYHDFEMGKPYASGQVMDPDTGYPLTTYSRFDPTKGWVTINPLGGKGEPSAPPTADAPALVPGKDVPEGVNPEALKGNPHAKTIMAIDEGRQNLTSVPMRLRAKIEKDLNNYDPKWDQTVWGARNKQQSDLATNGTAGKLILATNQLLPHLNTASEKAAALDNGNYPAANAVQNWIATQTGDPRVKSFQTVREVAALDAARLLRGSGQMAERDIEEWRKNIGEAGSPAQLQQVIGLLADDLIGARVGSIAHGYRTVMGKEPPELVSPEAKEALAAIKKRMAATPSPGGGGPAPVKVQSPEEASKLPKGTPIILPDGRTGVVP